MSENNFKNPATYLKQFGTGFLLAAFCLPTFSLTATAQFGKNRAADKSDTAIAADEKSDRKPTDQIARRTIAPDLEAQTDEVFYHLRGDATQKVIIQLKSETPLDQMPGDAPSEADQDRQMAQEVGKNKAQAGMLTNDLTRLRGRFKQSFDHLGLVSAELPLSKIRELAQSEEVEYISPDRETSASGHLETTTGTAQIRALLSGGITTNLNGDGIGIAVIDSGVDKRHRLHDSSTDEHTGIVYTKDFTGENSSKDPYLSLIHI